jgi:uncharacterized OB-fold protein
MPEARFWRESQARYNMIGRKCGNCGKVFFPPRDICPKCRRASMGKMENIKLSGKGTVVSYSVVHEGLPAFQMQIPYTMAIIELEEGTRITGQIVDCCDGIVKIGSKVETVFRKLGEEGKSGIIYYGYKFKLIE